MTLTNPSFHRTEHKRRCRMPSPRELFLQNLLAQAACLLYSCGHFISLTNLPPRGKMAPPPRTRRIFLRDKEIPLGGIEGGRWRGICATCPKCGEQWARVELASWGEYIISVWPCGKHGSPWRRGGSLLKLLSWFDAIWRLGDASQEFLIYEIDMKVNQNEHDY